VLERFSQSGDAAAEQPPQQRQQPLQQQQQHQRSSLAAGGGSGNWGSKMGAVGALVPLAPPTVVYTAFAPLVVSTLKVGCAQQSCACSHAVCTLGAYSRCNYWCMAVHGRTAWLCIKAACHATLT
jgi:hypothetical protein